MRAIIKRRRGPNTVSTTSSNTMSTPTFQIIYYTPDFSDRGNAKWVKESALSPKAIYHDFWEATVGAFNKAREKAEKKYCIAWGTEREGFWYDVILDVDGKKRIPIGLFEAIDSEEAGEASPWFYEEERVR